MSDSIKHKAALFDALMNQDVIQVVHVEELGNPGYQYISLNMWTHHLGANIDSVKTNSDTAKKTLKEYLEAYLEGMVD